MNRAARPPVAGTEEPALKRVRQLCLELPGTSETDSWGHPNFRAGKVTFVTYEWFEGNPSVAFRVDGDTLARLIGRPGFFATPYGRGRWVSLRIGRRTNWKLVASLVRTSYLRVATARLIRQLEDRADSA